MIQRPRSALAAVKNIIFSQRNPTTFNILDGTRIQQSAHEELDDETICKTL